jgi:hypothetical protein
MTMLPNSMALRSTGEACGSIVYLYSNAGNCSARRMRKAFVNQFTRYNAFPSALSRACEIQ